MTENKHSYRSTTTINENGDKRQQTYPITRRLPNGQHKDEGTGEVSWPTTRDLNDDPFINIGGGGR